MEQKNGKSKKISKSNIKTLAKGKGYSFVESFSGPGGMCLGLKRSQFELVVAFDNDEKAVETHGYNLGGKCIEANARNVDGKFLYKNYGIRKGALDLFAGGPPCQGFSKQKRGAHLGDDRNDLVSEYIRIVKDLEPRFFLFENVAVFGQKRGRTYVEEILIKLELYNIYPHFYNCADYGLAQTRERFIIVGCRKDLNGGFRIPAPTVEKWKTVGEVLKGLPEPPADFSIHPKFANHQRAKISKINIERFSHVPQGGGWQDIPRALRLKCHKEVNIKSGGWPDVYGRLEWDGQCPTITGGFDNFSRGRYGHPKYNRPITPREAARLQGFPDDFIFMGTRSNVRSQIGNAVPPPLAEAIGVEILRGLLAADGLIDANLIGHQTTGRQLALSFS